MVDLAPVGVELNRERVLGGNTALLRGVVVVHPDVARADAERGGVAVEDHGAQAVDGQARVAPQPPLHEVVHQVRALVVQALVAHGIREVVLTGESSFVREVFCAAAVVRTFYTL